MALVTKVHHALMDGSAGGDLMASLFDLEPEPGPSAEPPHLSAARPGPSAEPAAWQGEPPPSRARLLAEAGPAALGRAARLPATVAHTMTSLASSAGAVVAQPSSVAGVAPATPFNGALTVARSVAFNRCPLDDLKQVKRVFGTTINDVVLAATTLSIRRYLLAHHVEPDRPLVASVPVAGRRREDTAFGNHTSNVMVSLPVQLDDPVGVLRSIHQGAAGAKAARQALDSDVMAEWIAMMPAALLSAGAGLYSSLRLGGVHPPFFNVIVSNMAGPPIPLYLAGARLVATYPMGPLIGNTGLNLTVLSQTGDLDVGVIACPDLVDDVRSIADEFVGAVAELLDLAVHAEELGDAPAAGTPPSGPPGATL